MILGKITSAARDTHLSGLGKMIASPSATVGS